MVQEVRKKGFANRVGTKKHFTDFHQASFCIDDLRIANLKQDWPIAESCKQPDKAEQNMTDGHG